MNADSFKQTRTAKSFASALALSTGAAPLPVLAQAACGTIPTVVPVDPSNVLGTLDASYASSCNGHANELAVSPWVDSRSDKETGFTDAILWGPLDSDTQVAFVETATAELERHASVADVVVQTASANDAVVQQVKQFNGLVAQGVDAIIAQPLPSEVPVSPIDTAAAAGIPTIVLLSSVSSTTTINLGASNFATGLAAGSGEAQKQITFGWQILVAVGVYGRETRVKDRV